MKVQCRIVNGDYDGGHNYAEKECPICTTIFCYSCCGGTNVDQGGKYERDFMFCPECGYDYYATKYCVVFATQPWEGNTEWYFQESFDNFSDAAQWNCPQGGGFEIWELPLYKLRDIEEEYRDVIGYDALKSIANKIMYEGELVFDNYKYLT